MRKQQVHDQWSSSKTCRGDKGTHSCNKCVEDVGGKLLKPCCCILISLLSPFASRKSAAAFFWLVLLSVRLCGAPIPDNPTKL